MSKPIYTSEENTKLCMAYNDELAKLLADNINTVTELRRLLKVTIPLTNQKRNVLKSMTRNGEILSPEHKEHLQVTTEPSMSVLRARARILQRNYVNFIRKVKSYLDEGLILYIICEQGYVFTLYDDEHLQRNTTSVPVNYKLNIDNIIYNAPKPITLYVGCYTNILTVVK